MAYCSYCGQKLARGAEYCSKCGKPVNGTDNNSNKIESVSKCPACGCEIPSFTAVCPACGTEINTSREGSSIKDFTDRLQEYDARIANSNNGKPVGGWNSWGMPGKIGWVILNIYLMCIPLLIYFFVRRGSKDNPEVQQKASFVQTYVFKNERETIIEAMIFVKSQLSSIISGGVVYNPAFWEGIWMGKATQLNEKAAIIMPGDTIVKQTYDDIVTLDKAYKKKQLQTRIIIIAVIVLVLVMSYAAGGKS